MVTEVEIKKSKINRLIQSTLKGLVLLSPWLVSEGYPYELHQRYRIGGWQKSIGNKNRMKNLFLFVISFLSLFSLKAQVADKTTYLSDIKQELQKTWPENRTINLVFHGHSVPSGYFDTPNVRTLQSYPYLTLQTVKEYYPYSVVNCITTAIGGENSEQGCARFTSEVLIHRPDVVFIDYALNDRGMGLERARKAWETMIQEALKQHVKVVLMTPTPDLTEDILNPEMPLEKHARQIRELAAKYQTGLVDSYAAFKQLKLNGEDLNMYMSQFNHPNEKGHRIVCDMIAQWLLEPEINDNLK